MPWTKEAQSASVSFRCWPSSHSSSHTERSLHEIRDGKMLLPGERGHDAQVEMRSAQEARGAAEIILAGALTWPDPGSRIRWGGRATGLGWEASPGGASSPLPSLGRQVELRPHLCSHLERVWRGVAGAELRPRGAQRDGPARLSDLQLIETPCSRRSARSPDSCRAEPGRMENPGCAGPTGAGGRGCGGAASAAK